MSDAYEGGCVCGAVRYCVRGQPVITQICHCTFCQRRLGSAFATIAYFAEQDVEWIRGALTDYEHRSDETGRWLKMQFCPSCGTTVTHTAEVRPGLRAFAGGTFDDPNWLRIERHIWGRSKRPWVLIPPNVPVFPQGSPGTSAPTPAPTDVV
jgi:hypothetical protein